MHNSVAVKFWSGLCQVRVSLELGSSLVFKQLTFSQLSAMTVESFHPMKNLKTIHSLQIFDFSILVCLVSMALTFSLLAIAISIFAIFFLGKAFANHIYDTSPGLYFLI